MAWLRRAVAAGFKDANLLGRDKSLEELRGRGDFREMISNLEAKPGSPRGPGPGK